MGTFNTNCPHCNGELEVQDEYIGMTLECPLCQSEFVLQKKETAPTEKPCPSCGNMINIKATRCRFCQKDITQLSTTPSSAVSEKKPKGKRIVLFSILGVLLVILITGAIIIVNRIQSHQELETKIKLAEKTLNDKAAKISDYEMLITMLESSEGDTSSQTEKEYIKKLLQQLQTQKEILSSVESGKAVLNKTNVSSQECRAAISTLESVNKKYSASNPKKQTEELIRQLKAKREVFSWIENGRFYLNKKNTTQNEYETAIKKLESATKKYPDAAPAKKTEELIKQLTTKKEISFAFESGRFYLNKKDVTPQECETAVKTLESATKKYPNTMPAKETEELIKQLMAKKEAVTQIPSRQAVAQIQINNSKNKTQLAIRKKINLSNSCNIMVYPADRKEHAKNINNKIAGIRNSFNQYKHHLNEAKRFNQLASSVNVTGIDSFQRSSNYSNKALEHVNNAKSSIYQAKNYHEEVKALMLNDVLASMKDIGKKEYSLQTFPMKNNSCDISNIRGPVIILAVETINYGDGFESYQAWYMEYTPFGEKTWELK